MTESKKGKTGLESVVEMLQHMDGPSREKLLANLHERDPKLVSELTKRLWTLEDLQRLEPADLQLALREIPAKKLALALRKSSESLRERIFSNLSSRAAQVLQEDIAALGPQRLSEVEKVQAEIGELIRQLIESGKIQEPSAPS